MGWRERSLTTGAGPSIAASGGGTPRERRRVGAREVRGRVGAVVQGVRVLQRDHVATRDLGTLTHETSVETQVVLERFARLETPAMIDVARLEAQIDAAVAGAVVSDDDIDVTPRERQVEPRATGTSVPQEVAEAEVVDRKV